VSAWLKSRGLEAATVEDLDLARAIPPSATLPGWARFAGKAWNGTPQGFRALFPLYGPTGTLESVRVRALHPTATNDKAGAAAGYELRGLMLADALGRRLLEGDRDAAELVAGAGLVVAEGEPDFLTWATRQGDAAEVVPAVLGLVAGSWTPELAARVPAGTKIALRTHRDAAGDRYADQVLATVPHCKVYRVKGNANAAA
jgi:hypothetical protein